MKTSIVSVAVLLALATLIATPRLMAEPNYVRIPVIPPGGSVNSTTFGVKAVGSMRVNLSLRTLVNANTKNPRSTYYVTLRRGVPIGNTNSGGDVVSKTVYATAVDTKVEFFVDINSCSEGGIFHFNITNARDNPQIGIASYRVDGQIYAATPNGDTRILGMAGVSVIDLDRGNERSVDIGSFAKPGMIELRAKWHVPAAVPTFKPLKLYLVRPDGTIAKGGLYYSFHYSGTSAKFDIRYSVTTQDIKQTGSWKLRISNPGDTRIEGFNIQRGSDRIFMPNFTSVFTTACGA